MQKYAVQGGGVRAGEDNARKDVSEGKGCRSEQDLLAGNPREGHGMSGIRGGTHGSASDW